MSYLNFNQNGRLTQEWWEFPNKLLQTQQLCAMNKHFFSESDKDH